MSQDETEKKVTAAAQTVPATSKKFMVTDALGRKLHWQAPNAAEKGRLMRAMGDHASNQAFFGYAGIMAGVRMIDEVPCMWPQNLKMVDEHIALVGDEGYEAITSKYAELEEERGDQTAIAKNSQASQS